MAPFHSSRPLPHGFQPGDLPIRKSELRPTEVATQWLRHHSKYEFAFAGRKLGVAKGIIGFSTWSDLSSIAETLQSEVLVDDYVTIVEADEDAPPLDYKFSDAQKMFAYGDPQPIVAVRFALNGGRFHVLFTKPLVPGQPAALTIDGTDDDQMLRWHATELMRWLATGCVTEESDRILEYFDQWLDHVADMVPVIWDEIRDRSNEPERGEDARVLDLALFKARRG